MNKNDLYPVLYECCQITKGNTQSLLCDIQRESYRLIPNEVADLLEQQSGKTIKEIKQSYNNKFDAEIEKTYTVLEREEFVFFTDQPNWLPKMNLSWNS